MLHRVLMLRFMVVNCYTTCSLSLLLRTASTDKWIAYLRYLDLSVIDGWPYS